MLNFNNHDCVIQGTEGQIMITSVFHKIGLVCLLVAVGILLCVEVVAGDTGYPVRTGEYVNDYAGLLDATSRQTIHDMLQKFENDEGIESVVVTINSIQDYGTGDSTIEYFAQNLFYEWNLGGWEKDKGVLILVAVKDRDCRVQLGTGYGSQYDSALQQVIDEHMLPYFKAGNYQTGILEGSRNVIDVVTKQPLNVTTENVVSWLSKYKWFIAAGLGAFIAFLLLRAALRRSRFGRLFAGGDDGGDGGGGSGGSGGGGATGHW